MTIGESQLITAFIWHLESDSDARSMTVARRLKRVAFLGPRGTFSHEAAMVKFPKADLVEKQTLYNVFESVYVADSDYCVLPVENSTEGIIAQTYHMLVEQGLNPVVKIQGESYLRIDHCLGVTQPVALDSIRHVHTEQETWDQCSNWVHGNLPAGIELVLESSTSKGVQVVAEKAESTRAAIASSFAFREFGMHTVAIAIQNHKSNATRFLIIGRRPLRKPKKQFPYKVTMGIVLLDRVGAIADSFRTFADAHVDVRSVKVSPVRESSLWNGKIGSLSKYLPPMRMLLKCTRP